MASSGPPTNLLRRAAATCLLVGAAYLTRRIPLLDLDELVPLHVGEFGITPATTAFLWVEAAAFVVPQWRKLRHDTRGRVRLNRAVAVVTLVMALVQGFALATFVEQTFGPDGSSPNLYTGSRFVMMLLLTLGAAVYWYLAGAITRFGLGNGFSLLSLMELILRIKWKDFELVSPVDLAKGFAVPLFVAALVGFAMAQSRPNRAGMETESTWRARLPACGIIPLQVALLLPTLSNSLRAWAGSYGLGVAIPDLLSGTGDPRLNGLGAAVLLAAMLSERCNPRRVIVDARRRLFPDEETGAGEITLARRDGVIRSSLLVLLLMVLVYLPTHFGSNLRFQANVLFTVPLGAVVIDLWAEFAFRRQHGDVTVVLRLHRICTTDLALEALGREGIPCVAKGLYHRTLLQFVGPYVPTELLVPADKAEEALDLLWVLEKDAERVETQEPPYELAAAD